MLIAEDHPGVTKAVCRVLALDCDVVATVADGTAVLEAVQRLRPDVIVVDLNLPSVNGFEVCRRITQLNPEAKVIVFTAMNDPDVRQRSLDVGASALCPKRALVAISCRPLNACVTNQTRGLNRAEATRWGNELGHSRTSESRVPTPFNQLKSELSDRRQFLASDRANVLRAHRPSPHAALLANTWSALRIVGVIASRGRPRLLQYHDGRSCAPFLGAKRRFGR